MSQQTQKQINYPSDTVSFIKKHKVSLGLLLAAYGAFYLSVVFLSGWSIFDWGKDITTYASFEFNGVLPRSFIAPIFFITSLPALLIGAALLSAYCLRGLNINSIEDRERVAIILTAFGFTYIVIGAWPLGNVIDFPWEFQKQIFNNGPMITWMLYSLGVIILLTGVYSLHKCSTFYHKNHPQSSLDV